MSKKKSFKVRFAGTLSLYLMTSDTMKKDEKLSVPADHPVDAVKSKVDL